MGSVEGYIADRRSFLPQKQRFIGCPAIGEHLLDSAAVALPSIDAPLNVKPFANTFYANVPRSPSPILTD